EASRAPGTYSDAHLAGGHAPQSIGHATANEVFKVRYDQQYAMRGGETAGYFKRDSNVSAPAKNAVAASLLAKRLGWEDLIPETHWASHQLGGNQGAGAPAVSGAVSKAAPGETLASKVKATPGGKGGDEFLDVDLSRSNTQRQLNQLQWFDA